MKPKTIAIELTQEELSMIASDIRSNLPAHKQAVMQSLTLKAIKAIVQMAREASK